MGTAAACGPGLQTRLAGGPARGSCPCATALDGRSTHAHTSRPPPPGAMAPTATLAVEDGVAIITLANPPVNALHPSGERGRRRRCRRQRVGLGLAGAATANPHLQSTRGPSLPACGCGARGAPASPLPRCDAGIGALARRPPATLCAGGAGPGSDTPSGRFGGGAVPLSGTRWARTGPPRGIPARQPQPHPMPAVAVCWRAPPGVPGAVCLPVASSEPMAVCPRRLASAPPRTPARARLSWQWAAAPHGQCGAGGRAPSMPPPRTSRAQARTKEGAYE